MASFRRATYLLRVRCLIENLPSPSPSPNVKIVPLCLRFSSQMAAPDATTTSRAILESAAELAGREEITSPSNPANPLHDPARPTPRVNPSSPNVNRIFQENTPLHNRLLLRPSHLRRGDQSIPMKAFYISRSVDLKALKDEPLLETINYSRVTLVARCKFCSVAPHYQPEKPWQEKTSWSSGPFLVVFHYGAAVLGNFRMQDEEDLYLNLVKKHSLESLDHTEEARKDDYKIVVRPTLATWSQAGYDTIFLQKLDLDNIRVVCSVLAQSVALEHHLRKADGMVNTFSKLNSGMEETGNFTMSRKELFQLVASANTTLADLVLRVRLLDRTRITTRGPGQTCLYELPVQIHEKVEWHSHIQLEGQNLLGEILDMLPYGNIYRRNLK